MGEAGGIYMCAHFDSIISACHARICGERKRVLDINFCG